MYLLCFYRGLLGGHFAALALKNTGKGMLWYNNELVAMAKEIGYRLLPAFNTSTGIPYPRVSSWLTKMNVMFVVDVLL